MIERILERLQDDVSATREQLSELIGRFDAVERLISQVEGIEKATHEHVAADAELHGKLSTDLSRLWWGASALFTAAAGVIVSLVVKAVGGSS